ncbi:hypothetical protein JHW43_000572 [Diplocarpon mali]|nr:hypothetical protein JHW43_000572 [Diplocarpon mali]
MGKLPRITESAPAMNASGSVLAWVSRPEGFRASGLPCLRAAKGAMGRHEEEREGRGRDFHSRAVPLGCGRETGVGRGDVTRPARSWQLAQPRVACVDVPNPHALDCCIVMLGHDGESAACNIPRRRPGNGAQAPALLVRRRPGEEVLHEESDARQPGSLGSMRSVRPDGWPSSGVAVFAPSATAMRILPRCKLRQKTPSTAGFSCRHIPVVYGCPPRELDAAAGPKPERLRVRRGAHSMRGERGVDSGLAKRKLSPTELQASDFISSACHVSHPVLPRSPHQRPRKFSVVSLPGKSLVRSPSPPVLRPACAHAGTLLSRSHRDSSTAKSRGSVLGGFCADDDAFEIPGRRRMSSWAWISTRPTEPSNLHRMIHACSLAIAATGSEGRSGRCAGSLLAWIPLVNAQPSVTMPMNSTVDPHDRPIYARPHTSTSDRGSDLEHKGLSGPENTLGDLQKQVQALYLGKNKETESHRGLASSTALGGGVSHVVTLVVLLHGRDQLRRLLMASPCDAKIITRASGPKLNLFNKELSAPIRFFGIQKRPISEVSGIFPGIYRASRVPRNPGSPSTTAPSDHPHHRDIVPALTGFRVAAPDEPHP